MNVWLCYRCDVVATYAERQGSWSGVARSRRPTWVHLQSGRWFPLRRQMVSGRRGVLPLRPRRRAPRYRVRPRRYRSRRKCITITRAKQSHDYISNTSCSSNISVRIICSFQSLFIDWLGLWRVRRYKKKKGWSSLKKKKTVWKINLSTITQLGKPNQKKKIRCNASNNNKLLSAVIHFAASLWLINHAVTVITGNNPSSKVLGHRFKTFPENQGMVLNSIDSSVWITRSISKSN